MSPLPAAGQGAGPRPAHLGKVAPGLLLSQELFTCAFFSLKGAWPLELGCGGKNLEAGPAPQLEDRELRPSPSPGLRIGVEDPAPEDLSSQPTGACLGHLSSLTLAEPPSGGSSLLQGSRKLRGVLATSPQS